MAPDRTVLVVGTDPAADALAAAEPSLTVRTASDADAAAVELDDGSADCVLTAHDQPAVDGLAVVAAAADRGVPAVLATANGSEELASEAVAAGATAYVPTDPTDPTETLGQRLRSAVERGPDREREQYETIMETVPEGIFVLDENGVGLTGNRVGARMLGCTYEELVGSQIAELAEGGVFDPSVVERYLDTVRDLLSSESDTDVGVIEFEASPESGGTRVYEVRLALRPYDDAFRGVIGVIRDITERRRRSRRLQVLNRVLRHNLGNEMNVVAGTAARIAEHATDPDQEARAERVRRRAEDLVDDSQTVRQMEGIIDHDRSDRRAMDVTRVLEAAVGEIRWGFPDATFDVEAPESLHADAYEGLQHAVEQVLENAAEHSEASSPTVSVVLDRRTVDDVEWVSLRVADDGPGLPPGERAVVTDGADITPLNHGSGLGLWVVRWVIESLDGEMAIEERESGGTVVELRLRPASS